MSPSSSAPPPPPAAGAAGLTTRRRSVGANAAGAATRSSATPAAAKAADAADAAPAPPPPPARPQRPPDAPAPLLLFVPLLFPVLLMATSTISAAVISKQVPSPYMDEVFHVPQTRRLCERGPAAGLTGGGWDPKITTPAGLYLLGAGYASLQAALLWAMGGAAKGQGWAALQGALCGEAGALRGLNCALLSLCLLPAFSVRLGVLGLQRRRRRRRRGSMGAPGGPDGAAAGGGDANKEEEQEEQEDDARDALGTALAAAVLLPTHFFFGFLFYTDVGALLFLLFGAAALQWWAAAACAAAAAAAGRQSSSGSGNGNGNGNAVAAALAAALAGGASVAMRQTNAVWYAFLVGAALLRVAFATLGREAADRRRPPAASSSWSLSLSGPVVRALAALGRHARATGPAFAAQLALLLLPVAAFAAFVVLANGGRVALGDHDAHGALGSTRHWLHPWLAACFAALGAGAPFVARPEALRRLGGRFCWVVDRTRRGGGGSGAGAAAAAAAAGGGAGRTAGGRRGGKGGGGGGRAAGARVCLSPRAVAGGAAVVAAALASARFGTVAHPYLLADNRHYAFYAWRRTLGRHWAAKYALAAPLGAVAWLLLASELAAGAPGGGGNGGGGSGSEDEEQGGGGQEEGVLWVLGFAAACVATLVPAGLIEPRYYTAPAVLAMLHAPARLRAPTAAEEGEEEGDGRRATDAPPTANGGCRRRFDWSALVACVAFAAVDAVTLYVFAYRPFAWPDGSTARFMW